MGFIRGLHGWGDVRETPLTYNCSLARWGMQNKWLNSGEGYMDGRMFGNTLILSLLLCKMGYEK